MNDLPEKRKPEQIDYETAQRNNPDWDTLTTRKKNSLARNEMFHREYHGLCEAIMGFRPKGQS